MHIIQGERGHSVVMKRLAGERIRDNEALGKGLRRCLFCCKITGFSFLFSPDCCNFSCLDVIIYVFSKQQKMLNVLSNVELTCRF